MRRWLFAHGLVLVNFGLFVAFFVGMALTGWRVANGELTAHGQAALSLGAFLQSGDFVEALFENWESEFLQMGSYIILTVFLFQRGSPESKPLDRPAPQDADPSAQKNDPDAPWPVRRGGWWLLLYENSLLILFALLFVGSFLAHAFGGAAAYSGDQVLHGLPPVSANEYLTTAQFWFESFQNWQSEFMVVALLIGASVWLRQRGSPESKPVASGMAEN